MFGIGLWELAAILVVLLVLTRPGDAPALMRKLGRLYGRFTAMSGTFRREIDAGIREGEKEQLREERRQRETGTTAPKEVE